MLRREGIGFNKRAKKLKNFASNFADR